MRLLLFGALALSGCELSTPVDLAEVCAQLATANQGCWNTQLDEQCELLAAQCGDRIRVMESCPVQLACP